MSEPGTASSFTENIGVVMCGNTMFRCGEGPWGDENPWGVPVYVLTHTARDPVYRQGEVAFRFVTNGVESALEQAKMNAGDKDVLIGGGANVIQQYLRAGHIQELEISLVPTLLGEGTRLLDGVEPSLELALRDTVPTSVVTHLRYQIKPIQR
jgi:dihydrofolate reductase